MEAFTHSSVDSPHRLSGLYTQHKAARPPASTDDSPEVSSIHHKYRFQRDRLIAWGLEWNDGENSPLNIEDSVERAGLTEVVLSVMENIKLILDEIESIRPSLSAGLASDEKIPRAKTGPWTRQEKEQYRNLAEDFTRAIDLLCDLKARREPAKGAAESKSEKGMLQLNYKTHTPSKSEKPPPAMPRTTGLLKIDPSLLSLPTESPPPYDDGNVSRPIRVFANLRKDIRSNTSLPVLIEYVNSGQDSNTSVLISRLEQISEVLDSAHSRGEASLSRLIGYFQDAHQPRYGLVFELPRKVRRDMPEIRRLQSTQAPVTLLDVLQNSSGQHSQLVTNSALVPSLDQRFLLAKQITSCISILTANSCVHGQVNSHAITLLPRVNTASRSSRVSEYDIREPCLGGYAVSPGQSSDSSGTRIRAFIYCHPRAANAADGSRSRRQSACYDLYSLGLVLLEIGLWLPLSDIFKDKYTLQDFRTRIERIWVPRLAGKCGTAYMIAVQECISADELGDNALETYTGVFDRVMTRLARCCLMIEPEIEEIDDVVDDDSDQVLQQLLEEQKRQLVTITGKTPSYMSADADAEWPDYAETIAESISSAAAAAAAPQVSQPVTSAFPGPPTSYWDLAIPKAILDHWEAELMYRLGKVVDKELNRRPSKASSCSVSLDMCGHSKETAKPTIMVAVSRDWDVIDARLRRKFKNEQKMFDIAVYQGSVTRAKAGIARSSVSFTGRQALNAFHQERPVCGASIGVFVHGEHSPPVSFGGIVMVDEEAYGMTVHHMLEEPESEADTDDNLPASHIARSSYTSALSRHDDGIPNLAGSDSDQATRYADTSSDHSDTDTSDSEGEDEDVGDTEGISPSPRNRHLTVTQPALSDVPSDFFPVLEDRDDDHIDSHSLGHVHASSGLRRITHTLHSKPAKLEIDWALIKLHAARSQYINVITGGRTHCESHSDSAYRPHITHSTSRTTIRPDNDTYPRLIAPSTHLSGLSVHALGRTSGLSAGTIRGLALVRFPNRRTASRVWALKGGMGIPGDSGTWVFDNATGRVCGQILAWNEAGAVAYLAPMDMTLDDIRETLGADTVRLPGALAWEGSTGMDEVPSLRTVKIAPVRGAGAVVRKMAGFAARAGPSSSSPSRPLGHRVPVPGTVRHSSGRVMPAQAQLVETRSSPLRQSEEVPTDAVAIRKTPEAKHVAAQPGRPSRRPVPTEPNRGQRLRRMGGPGGSTAVGGADSAARRTAVNSCEA